MEILRAEDGGSKQTEEWLESRVKRYGARSLFLPAGETPRPIYARWRAGFPAFLHGLRLLQVDDVITGASKGMFARFFQEELPGVEVVPPVAEEKADLAILGLGTNGHVAFHEPGLPLGFRFGEVDLEADTAARLQLEPGARGVTYGVGVFAECKAVLLVVRGRGKEEAFQRFQAGDPGIPASGLRGHPDLTVLTDL